MRIEELLESVDINLDSKQSQNDNEKLNYDLVKDLVFFMNNDDDTYRRHVYPAITKCLDKIKAKEKTHPSIFKVAVLKSYKNYQDEYDEKHLPETLDDKVCNEACKTIHEETVKHANEGKYKD